MRVVSSCSRLGSCETSAGPTELRAQLAPQLAAFGITRVAELTDLDVVGLPVFGAIRPLSRNLAVSQGKGFSVDAAWIGAVAEALELRAAETVPVPDVRVLDDPTIERWRPPPATGSGALHSDGWVRACDWRTNAPVLVPRELVDLDLTRAPSDPRWRRTSNAMAAHPSRSLAVRHALLEAIERHALASAPARRREIRRLSGGRPANAALAALLDRLAACDLQPRLWRLPAIAGIEVVRARLPAAQPQGGWVVGAAASPELQTAACRALLECVQSRVTRLAGARDDLTPTDYRVEAEHAFADVRRAVERVEPWAAEEPRPPADAVAEIGEPLGRAGFFRLLVVDLPTAGAPLHVVKVVVPGLVDCFATERKAAA
jgi:ribosomal protein S12 methylthiotransferase accessory factor